MLPKYSPAVLLGLLAGIVFLVLLRRIALKYNLLIFKGIPLIGGEAIGLSFLAAYMAVASLSGGLTHQTAGIILSSLIMLVAGVIDDIHESSVRAKFFVQFFAASLLIISGVRTHIVYIGEPLNIIITYLWVIGITNAFNLLDIMDGLAAGAAIVAAIAFAAVSYLNHDNTTLYLTLSLLGPLLAFLKYNLPPAKLYMGNSGSHFLGIFMAGVALTISYASLETKIALLSPLLILGLPIFDTAFLVFMRLVKRRMPFKKSNDHLAFRYLALGYSKRKTLFIVLALAVLFSACGVTLGHIPARYALGLVGLAVLTGLIIGVKMSKVEIHG